MKKTYISPGCETVALQPRTSLLLSASYSVRGYVVEEEEELGGSHQAPRRGFRHESSEDFFQ